MKQAAVLNNDRDCSTGRGTDEPPDVRPAFEAVGWMLGPELIANLRAMLRRKAERSDPRTWMVPYFSQQHDENRRRNGQLLARDARTNTTPADAANPHEDIWFDYIADMGDSNDAMYATAYGCQVDLQYGAPGTALPRSCSDATDVIRVHRRHAYDQTRSNLPRGKFLFVGGDTAYHVADEATLRNRVERPFNWAYSDLKEKQLLSGEGTPRLYGIPGNHDWYNDLHGFALLFLGISRRPIQLANFVPHQLASYVAIELPYGWQLFGLDIDQNLDDRQRQYFSTLLPTSNEESPMCDPARLILCTPSPPIAFHTVIVTDEHRDALDKLGLARPFDLSSTSHPGRPLPEGACRLDLSGDIHHYARYQDTTAGRHGGSYAAVVSGLGGAFHHPSFTEAGKLKPKAVYPEPEASLKAVAPLLLHWRSLIVGSWIRGFPVVFGLVMAFGSIAGGGASWLLDRLLGKLGCAHSSGVGSREEFLKSLLLLAVLAVTVCLGALALKLFRSAYQARIATARQSTPKAPTRVQRAFARLRMSYAPSAIAGTVAAALVCLFRLCPHAGAVAGGLDVAVFVLLGLATVGGFALAWSYGGADLPLGRRLLVSALGVIHGVAQIATPFLCARLIRAEPMTMVVIALSMVWWGIQRWRQWTTAPSISLHVVGVVLAILAQLLLAPTGSTGLATGLVIVATWILLAVSRGLFRRRCGAGVALIWLIAWIGGLVTLIYTAGGEMPVDESMLWNVPPFVAGAVMSVPLCTSYFAWYLAIAGLAGAHNNEVGGAARVTQFRQMIRFHVHKDGLTGYVISIEGTSPSATRGEQLEFKLRDIFTVTPQSAP